MFQLELPLMWLLAFLFVLVMDQLLPTLFAKVFAFELESLFKLVFV